MNVMDVAIYNALAGSTALTTALGGTAIFQWLAPENRNPPYVVYNKQAGTPIHTFGGVAIENDLYTVRGVTIGPSAVAGGTIAKLINDALADRALTITGYTHLYLRRVSDVDYPEVVAGVRFYHRGAMYRAMADPAG
jgi:hypothetical protein